MGTENRSARRRPFATFRAPIAVAMVVLALILAAVPANAQDSTPATSSDSSTAIAQEPLGGASGFFDVVEVNGLIDPVMASFINRSLDESLASGARGVVLQMQSEGVAISDDELAALTARIAEFEVPVSVWLGPSGSGKALGGAGQLALVSSRIGMTPGSELGDFGESVLTGAAVDGPFATRFQSGFSGGVFGYEDLFPEGEDGAVASVDIVELVEGGAAIQNAPTVLLHLLELADFESRVVLAGEELPNGSILPDDADPIRVPVSSTRFVTLPLIDQQFHTFASPAVAFLLFVIGMGLLVFELFTAGVGVAGVIGAGSFLAGGYGLAVLDARWWAIAMLVIAFVGFAIDVQSGIQAFWSTAGSILLVVGSLLLLPDHSIGWLPLSVGIIGVLLAMLGGMPAMVRTRFSTPTIGREWMIGEVGDVVEAVDPEGVVTLRGAPWRARTNRATPIAAGERARVVEVDGLLLEVEPESGGAADYRERRSAEHAEAVEAEAES